MVKKLVNKSSKLAEQLMRQWQAGVVKADYWITRLTSGTVESRVACLLKILVQFDGKQEKTIIRLPPNTDMAAIVNATVESVSRTVAKLKRARVLRRVEPHTYQCDLRKL
jgi:CRP-like cAMP-binding protein